MNKLEKLEILTLLTAYINAKLLTSEQAYRLAKYYGVI